MATSDRRLVSRKGVSLMLQGEVSPRMVKFHEKRWGLDRCRVSLGTRRVLYDRAAVEKILRERGGPDKGRLRKSQKHGH